MQLDPSVEAGTRPVMNDAWGESTRMSFDELCRSPGPTRR
jgi:hypothetical protein